METEETANIWDDSLSNILLSNAETLMSDENIAQELALQEALFSSFTTPQKPTSETAAESSKMGSKSSSSHTLCEICAERKGNTDIFPLNCVHNYCTDCISKHVTILINKRRTLVQEAAVVTCPASDCTAVLETHTLRAVLPADEVSVWDDILCESLINPNSKYYCPYKDCSGLLVRENDDDSELIRESECPFCHRLFCAKCNVAWHSGIGCEEREKLKEDERERESELKLHDLAKESKWQRCPNCKFYVDKNQGCLHMTCRCGFQFCYSCGKAWTSTHGGCG